MRYSRHPGPRSRIGLCLAASATVALASVSACSGSSKSSGFDPAGGGGGGGGGDSDGGGSGTGFGGEGGATGSDGGGTTTSTTTIYANTDDSLYTLDPQSQAVTLVGKFNGATGNLTDIAVNANGDVYVNSTSVVYKAQLPASGGSVSLTKVATIAAKNGASFFALAFAPAGVLGAGEALVGGDANGELWSIDPTSGATTDLGSFGKDPADATKVLALSGDLVFYTNGGGKPTGLATVRVCSPGGSNCSKSNDYLAGVDMAALAAAFTSGTPAASLLSGIYGGASKMLGKGVGQGEVFGLGAWEGKVYGFARSQNGTPPVLLSIDTTTGVGTALPGSQTFTNGWSGGGVSTKTAVNIPPPSSVK